MSFVRFGVDGSQVYIFEHVDDTIGKTCCGCALNERLPDRTDAELAELWVPLGTDREFYRQRWAPDFSTTDLDAMLCHLAEHRAARHVIPRWLDARLIDEWTERAVADPWTSCPGCGHVMLLHDVEDMDGSNPGCCVEDCHQRCSNTSSSTSEVPDA